jgi:tetratricopeptide (TPR) repeat protein
LKTALELDPKVPDSHFYYGMLAFANGKNDLGYAEVKEAIAMKRNWTNANEPRVAADYFADSGHLGDALELYQASLALDPGNLETATKIGIVYYLQGNKPLARQSLLEVASKFDFTTSPSYASYKPILDDLGIH